jgi:hypothetical protein
MIAKLICLWKGHKRGRLNRVENGQRVFSCPRCHRETSYKDKA